MIEAFSHQNPEIQGVNAIREEVSHYHTVAVLCCKREWRLIAILP
jgi:hypothetical protein